jgi:hypothetical protein
MSFNRLGAGVSVALGLAGCSLIGPPEAAQPAALAVAVEKGCLPFALGERGESAAMADAGLQRTLELPSWPSPGIGKPQYSGGAGNPVVTIYGPGCTVRARGKDAQAFEAALDGVYRRRFGDGYGARPLPPQPTDGQFPGMRRFCAAGHAFQSYPDPVGMIGDRGFNVMIGPSTLCHA